MVTKFLEGKNKPVYHPLNDTGDHVVIINSKEVKSLIIQNKTLTFKKHKVSLLGREWQYRVYFHHTGYPSAFKVEVTNILSKEKKMITTMFSTWVHGMDLCGFLHGNFMTETQP